jgi:bifunctional ADP-heptose synthase (sugar kinase/adenylyltransferase)
LALSNEAVKADNSAVEAAEQSWRPLGELLLEKGLVTKDELELALEEQAETERLLGAILVERGYVSGPALAVALAEQRDVGSALRFANAAAALACTKRGAQPSLPTRAEVERLGR